MDGMEYSEAYAKGYVDGEIDGLKNLVCKIKSECSFGIITYAYLLEVITQMIDNVGGEA